MCIGKGGGAWRRRSTSRRCTTPTSSPGSRSRRRICAPAGLPRSMSKTSPRSSRAWHGASVSSLENRLEVLILHLLKWDHQPDQRANRWRASVAEQRSRIRRLLQRQPVPAADVGRGGARRCIRRRSSRRRSRPSSARPHSRQRYPTPSSRSSSASCRRASCPSNDVPKEAPMTEHQTLTVRLHPDDNVVTARIDLLPKTAVGGEHVTCAARIPAGHKVATRPHRGRRADQEIQPDHRLRDRGDRARRSTSTPTMSRCATSPATTRSAPMRGRPPTCPKTGARASRASCATTARRARATSSACSRP